MPHLVHVYNVTQNPITLENLTNGEIGDIFVQSVMKVWSSDGEELFFPSGMVIKIGEDEYAIYHLGFDIEDNKLYYSSQDINAEEVMRVMPLRSSSLMENLNAKLSEPEDEQPEEAYVLVDLLSLDSDKFRPSGVTKIANDTTLENWFEAWGGQKAYEEFTKTGKLPKDMLSVEIMIDGQQVTVPLILPSSMKIKDRDTIDRIFGQD